MTSRSRNPDKEELSAIEITGRVLGVIGVFLVIMGAVLLNTEKIDLITNITLFVAGSCIFFTGLMIHHLTKNTQRKECKKKNIVFVVFMTAIVALTLVPVPYVHGESDWWEKQELELVPVSGSRVDGRDFYFGDKLVSDGFVTAVTMDLPVDKMQHTGSRLGLAVSLGDPWEIVGPPGYKWSYTPYVKEMWLKVEGGGDYEKLAEVPESSIVDNRGTGGESTLDFWTILNVIMTPCRTIPNHEHLCGSLSTTSSCRMEQHTPLSTSYSKR